MLVLPTNAEFSSKCTCAWECCGFMPHHYSNNKGHNKKDTHYSSIAHWTGPLKRFIPSNLFDAFSYGFINRFSSQTSHCVLVQKYAILYFHSWICSQTYSFAIEFSIFLKKIGRWPFRKTAIKDKYVCKLRMYIILCAYFFSN